MSLCQECKHRDGEYCDLRAVKIENPNDPCANKETK